MTSTPKPRTSRLRSPRLRLHRPQTSPALSSVISAVLSVALPHQLIRRLTALTGSMREQVAFMEEDRPLYDDINRLADVVRSGRFVEAVEAAVGSLD